MADDIYNAFDFGFTAVDEQELEAVQAAAAQVETTSATADDLQQRLNNLYNAVQPLLNNLKANPDKSYIWWPNRAQKVEAFSDMLDSIYNGNG